MLTVHKYPMIETGYSMVMMHDGAKVLKVQEQFGQLQLWALVDNGRPMVCNNFRIYGTGHPINEFDLNNQKYIDTVPMSSGLVWHIFMEKTCEY